MNCSRSCRKIYGRSENVTRFKAVCRGLCQYIFKAVKARKGADLRVGLLLGNREIHEDVPYVFVDGALEMETVAKGWGEGSLYRGCMAKGLSGSGKSVSQTNGTGVVFMRESGLQFKSIKLLAGTQPLFYRKKSADVFKQRPGG